MRRCRLHVMGASGTGTTTLARALADHWAVPHADTDDYFWVPSDPPYVQQRAEHERVALMHEVFVPRDAWVLSGSMAGWGDSVVDRCDAIVFMTLDPQERLARIEAREAQRRAAQRFDRDAWESFLAWARGYDDPNFHGRSRVTHDAWLAERDQPVLWLDSAASREQLRDRVLEWDPGSRT